MADWVSQLEAAGFPTIVLVIDFESYYGDDLTLDITKKGGVSIVEYVAHSDFELTGCGFGYINQSNGRVTPWFNTPDAIEPMLRDMQKQFGKNLERITVVAKNCKFDMLILAEKFGIYPKYTIDCDDLTRTFDSRMKKGMEEAAPVFKIGYKGDTSQFKNLHYADIIKQGLLDDLETYTLNDIVIEQQWIIKLLPIVDNPHIELPLAAHTLKLYTRPRLDFDFELCNKLIADMSVEIENTLRDVAPWVMEESGFSQQDIDEAFDLDIWAELVIDIIGKNLRFVPLLMRALPNGQSVPTKPGKPGKNMKILLNTEDQMPALAKTDDGCKWLIAHSDPKVSALMSARQAVNSWPSHIKRLTKMSNQARASHGKFRVPIKYHGAHTGRWTGEEQINPTNLGGSGRGMAISSLISQMRHTIKAPAGCSLVLDDAAQIEARNLAWFAGQMDLIKLFRTNGDPYSDLAQTIFQCKVWKWKDNDVEEYAGQKQKVKIYRGFGKDAILGCGYGMGVLKFFTRCLENDVLRPLFDSGEYTYQFIESLIKTYRTKYKKIPEFWRKVERAWRKATMHKVGVEIEGKLYFEHSRSGTTYITLPSGRRLRYHNARVTRKGELKNRHSTLWGGTLTENIVQATSRDFLAEWILQIERELDKRVVHHVYDEVIVLTNESDADETLEAVNQILSKGPAWAEGMPFAAEGQVSKHYTK
jgi:hypothetical protein